MKSYGTIVLVVALLACVPLLTTSNVVLNFMVIALLMLARFLFGAIPAIGRRAPREEHDEDQP